MNALSRFLLASALLIVGLPIQTPAALATTHRWRAGASSPPACSPPVGLYHACAQRSTLGAELFTPFNTPSTTCQCLGYGVGAGYHAPLVFGRVSSWRATRQGVIWLNAPPCTPQIGTGNWAVASCLADPPPAWASRGVAAPGRAIFNPPPMRPARPAVPGEPASPSDAVDPTTLPMPSI